MAVFRIERTKNYTVMSNYHLRDKALSLKSKGTAFHDAVLAGGLELIPHAAWRRSARKAWMPSAGRCGNWRPPVTSSVTSYGTGRAASVTPSTSSTSSPSPKRRICPTRILLAQIRLHQIRKTRIWINRIRKARRIKYREIKNPKIKYPGIKYRFHSLPGNCGGQAAGTERTGCDVGGRNAELSGFGVGEHRVRPPVPGVFDLPGGSGRDRGADRGNGLRQTQDHPHRRADFPHEVGAVPGS